MTFQPASPTATDDKTPSLSIKWDEEKGWILHCFAGCGGADVVESLGLQFVDLLPGKDSASGPVRGRKPRMSAIDALEAIDHHSLVVSVIAADILKHREMAEDTWDILAHAQERIGAARDICCPARYSK